MAEETMFASSFAAAFMGLNEHGEIAFNKETFVTSEENVKPQLLRLKQSAPEAIVLVAQTENSLYRLVKQLHEIGWEKPRYGTLFPGARSFLEQAGPLAEGIVFSDFPDVTTVLNEDGKRMYQKYVALYGEPASGAGLFIGAFEGFRAMVQAVQSDEPAPAYLSKAVFQGILGAWRFGPDGFWNEYRHVMKRIELGQPVGSVLDGMQTNRRQLVPLTLRGE